LDGSEEELLTYPRPVGEGIGFREEPIELTPVRARVFKSDLEMLSHIYKENISAEKGLAVGAEGSRGGCYGGDGATS
jgi:hypothetical protein